MVIVFLHDFDFLGSGWTLACAQFAGVGVGELLRRLLVTVGTCEAALFFRAAWVVSGWEDVRRSLVIGSREGVVSPLSTPEIRA